MLVLVIVSTRGDKMDNRPPVLIKGRPIQRERTRPRASLNRPLSFRSSRVKETFDRETKKTKSLIVKSLLAVAIALFVLLLNTIKLPFCQAIVGQVKTALSYEFRLKDIPENFKLVGKLLPSLKSVFSGQPEGEANKNESLVYYPPSDGRVIKLFNTQTELEKRSYGIDILAKDNKTFYACANGKIASIVDHEVYGRALWIDHSGGRFSFYGGIDKLEVEEGQLVAGGSRLGSIAAIDENNHILHFEIWIDNEPVDPLQMLEDKDKVVGQKDV